MGRPRQYTTATERQAAYRQRMKATTAWVNRASYERVETALTVLHDATWRALHQDNPLAQEIYRGNPLATLEAMVAWIVPKLQQDTTHSEDAQHSDVIRECSDPNHSENEPL